MIYFFCLDTVLYITVYLYVGIIRPSLSMLSIHGARVDVIGSTLICSSPFLSPTGGFIVFLIVIIISPVCSLFLSHAYVISVFCLCVPHSGDPRGSEGGRCA